MNRAEPYLRWLPSLVWAALILFFSGPAGGGEISRSILHWILPDTLSPETFASIHFLFRKSGHVFSYGLLGAMNATAMRHQRPAAAVALAIVVAILDESRQSLFPGRTGTPVDVLIDAAGAMAGVAVTSLFRRGRATVRGGGESGYDVAP